MISYRIIPRRFDAAVSSARQVTWFIGLLLTRVLVRTRVLLYCCNNLEQLICPAVQPRRVVVSDLLLYLLRLRPCTYYVTAIRTCGTWYLWGSVQNRVRGVLSTT